MHILFHLEETEKILTEMTLKIAIGSSRYHRRSHMATHSGKRLPGNGIYSLHT